MLVTFCNKFLTCCLLDTLVCNSLSCMMVFVSLSDDQRFDWDFIKLDK